MSERPEKRDVHGWIALDKAAGKTSTESVAAVRRLFRAKKAGHAGTLDPLATGVLPIAFGEATKTVPFVMDGQKTYRFTVRWGVETDTDDAEGRVTSTSEARPGADAIRAALPAFVGEIAQVPPRFSALKIEGERAYDLAREGETVALAARPVEVHRLELIATPDADRAGFEAECGKGTYVRALARDLGEALGTGGHLTALRRTASGGFTLEQAIAWDDLDDHAAARLVPLDALLLEVPAVRVGPEGAAAVRHGRALDARLVTDGFPSRPPDRMRVLDAEGRLLALAVPRGFDPPVPGLPSVPALHPDVVLTDGQSTGSSRR
jgi:tRNA pseudouridine55 synthase